MAPRFRTRKEEVADFIETASPLKIGEILQAVVQNYIGPENLVVRDEDSDSWWPSTVTPLKKLFLAYSSDGDEDLHLLPPHVAGEFCRLRLLSWLKTAKHFKSTFYFYMSHLMLSEDPLAALPRLDHVPKTLRQLYPPGFEFQTQPLLHATDPAFPLHGLENIVLDFSASEYFSLFKANVPPFDLPETHLDTHLFGAASLLQHCHHLTLCFGPAYRYCHPWNGLPDYMWDEEARERTETCSMGKIVDWILEYAWTHGYLQHLQRITLDGYIQDWVREKWERIFADWNEVKAKGLDKPKQDHKDSKDKSVVKWQDIHTSDIEAIVNQGRKYDEEYLPQLHYPPVCKCDKACSSLGPDPQILDPAYPNPWDDIKEEEGDPAEWENRPPEEDPNVWT